MWGYHRITKEEALDNWLAYIRAAPPPEVSEPVATQCTFFQSNSHFHAADSSLSSNILTPQWCLAGSIRVADRQLGGVRRLSR